MKILQFIFTIAGCHTCYQLGTYSAKTYFVKIDERVVWSTHALLDPSLSLALKIPDTLGNYLFDIFFILSLPFSSGVISLTPLARLAL